MLRNRLCRQGLSDAWCPTDRHVSGFREEYGASYWRSTLRPRPLPVTKSSNGTLGTRPKRVSARAMMTSFCSSGIVKQSKGDEDHLISSISATANSTMHQGIRVTATAQEEGDDHTPQFVSKTEPWHSRTADEQVLLLDIGRFHAIAFDSVKASFARRF